MGASVLILPTRASAKVFCSKSTGSWTPCIQAERSGDRTSGRAYGFQDIVAEPAGRRYHRDSPDLPYGAQHRPEHHPPQEPQGPYEEVENNDAGEPPGVGDQPAESSQNRPQHGAPQRRERPSDGPRDEHEEPAGERGEP